MTLTQMTSRSSVRSAVTGLSVLVCVCLFGWWGLETWYLGPRHDRISKIADAQDKAVAYQKEVRERVPIQRELRGYAGRTLGTAGEEVIDALRSRLNRIGAAVGLQGLSVSTSGVRKIASPADSEFPRELRGQADFYELSGELSGRGTYEQALSVVEMIEDEPYLHQVRRVSMRPRQNGSEIDVSVTLATIFFSGQEVPDRGEHPDLPQPPENADGTDAAKRLGARNVFQVPPPPPPPPSAPEPVKEAPPPPPSPPPYQDWVVTGVVSIDGAPELWVKHVKNNQVRHLAVGQRVLGATFVSAEGDRAVIEVDGEQCVVEVGWTLDKRKKVGE